MLDSAVEHSVSETVLDRKQRPFSYLTKTEPPSFTKCQTSWKETSEVNVAVGEQGATDSESLPWILVAGV